MLYAVIPAGGSGTRLWPLSRAGHPKFLHPLTGTGASLLQATVARLPPLTTPERTLVVTGAAHAAGGGPAADRDCPRTTSWSSPRRGTPARRSPWPPR